MFNLCMSHNPNLFITQISNTFPYPHQAKHFQQNFLTDLAHAVSVLMQLKYDEQMPFTCFSG